jgi:hypothetical protein
MLGQVYKIHVQNQDSLEPGVDTRESPERPRRAEEVVARATLKATVKRTAHFSAALPERCHGGEGALC